MARGIEGSGGVFDRHAVPTGLLRPIELDVGTIHRLLQAVSAPINTPMLRVTGIRSCSKHTGSPMICPRISSITENMCSGFTSAAGTQNSSPPKRATISARRKRPRKGLRPIHLKAKRFSKSSAHNGAKQLTVFDDQYSRQDLTARPDTTVLPHHTPQPGIS